MRKILFVTSSLFGAESQSGRVAAEFVEALRQDTPGSSVVERDLHFEAVPHLTSGAFFAGATPAERRTPEQQEQAGFADSLIEEVEDADTIVIAAPMYNFSIPSTLKAWIDHIARAGRTFRYTEKGPEGLLKDKRVFIVVSRGGVYSEGAANAFDFQEPYLRAVLGFLGLDNISFIRVEGLKISPEAAANGIERAREQISQLVPSAAVLAA